MMMMMFATTAAFSSCTLVHLKTSLYTNYGSGPGAVGVGQSEAGRWKEERQV